MHGLLLIEKLKLFRSELLWTWTDEIYRYGQSTITHKHTHARMHARTHARTHTHTHTHTHTQTCEIISYTYYYTAYKGLVRPVLDYGSSVWDPPGVVLQEELESVQKRAARFVTGNYNYETGSMTGILGQLKWESLKKRRKDNRLILLYKGLKGKASVPTDDLISKTRRCRNQHSMAFQTPIANTDVYKGSFFPQTIRDWNALPDSLISSAEDAEDCVAKFTSLVRARD